MTESDNENRGNQESQDEALLVALASGASVRQAADAVGISERTVRRRLDEPGFVQRLREKRADALNGVLGRLTFAAAGAVEALKNLMNNSKSDQVKLGAARAILEHCGKLRQDLEFEQRLAELERRMPNGRDR